MREIINSEINVLDRIAMEEKDYYESRYSISKYEEKPFCIVVPTYNNAANNRYFNNIKSIVMQDYTNFHIVVIDDASTDNTGGLIK
jgi:cellulose synthase/poly-beta-1,6-N-acetylglucosamine synthase-like glycosyltransferase